MTISTEIYPMLSEPIAPTDKQKRKQRRLSCRVCFLAGHCTTIVLFLAIIGVIVWLHQFSDFDAKQFNMLNKTVTNEVEHLQLEMTSSLTLNASMVDRIDALDRKMTQLLLLMNERQENCTHKSFDILSSMIARRDEAMTKHFESVLFRIDERTLNMSQLLFFNENAAFSEDSKLTDAINTIFTKV